MQKKRNIKKPSSYLVPALERGMKILEVLSDHPGGLLMGEMKELDLPAASLYRMLVTLTELEYVTKDETDRYRLGRKLLSLACKGLDQTILPEIAAPFMRELRNTVEETVALGVLSAGEGVVIDTIRSEQPVCVYVKPGHHFPLHTASPAKAILAFLPEEEQKEILEKIVFTKFTSRTLNGKKAYSAQLKEIKNSGVAFDMGEEITDLRCVGAPIFDSRAYPVAAIWVTGPESRLSEKRLQEISQIVKETAEKISNHII